MIRQTAPGSKDTYASLPAGGLPRFDRLLVVCAHPDDESFGLGAIIAGFSRAGAEVRLLTLTRGEASTLGAGSGDLAGTREEELAAAARVLGINEVQLLSYPDTALSSVPIQELARHILRATRRADAFLVFDESGITGHPDHRRATDAALLAAGLLDLPVLAWALPAEIAEALNAKFNTTFVGRSAGELDCSIELDRGQQLEAITCHQSQDNPVMRARLMLQGNREWFRMIRPGEPLPTS